MIGRWLDHAKPVVLDRFLENKMVPFILRAPGGEGCLVGVAAGYRGSWADRRADYDPDMFDPYGDSILAERFNRLCQRLVGIPHSAQRPFFAYRARPDELLGGARAAALIRSRVLRIKARRALATVVPQPVLV